MVKLTPQEFKALWTELRKSDRADLRAMIGSEWDELAEKELDETDVQTPERLAEILIEKYPEKKIVEKVKDVKKKDPRYNHC